MKAVIRTIAAGLCAVALSVSAAGFSENFDSYTTGSSLHGQGIWQGWDNTPSAGALVSSAFSLSSPNSANITGASDLVGQFPGISGGLWSFTINQYVPSSSTGNSYFILMNKYTSGGVESDYNWSVQIQNDMALGRVISDTGGGAFLPMVRNAWNTFRFDINFGANSVSEYYNGTLLSTHAWHDGTGANALAAIDLYANSAGPVYYDNLNIAVVPEPASLSLVALGGLLFAFRRKNR